MIPGFNGSGVLPPFLGDPGHKPSVSPYTVTMSQIARRFAISEQRKLILFGLLDYRAELMRRSITDGFQWIDGSFVEDVETTRSRPPKDLDLITVARRPPSVREHAAWRNFVHQNLYLFDPRLTSEAHKIDAYYLDLDTRPELIVESSTYWFGLFSHQRATYLWKGMLRVPLLSDDEEARNFLEATNAETP